MEKINVNVLPQWDFLNSNTVTNMSKEKNNNKILSLLSVDNNIELFLISLEEELLKRRNLDLTNLTPEEQFALLKNRSEVILPEKQFLEKLKQSRERKKPLLIKFWIDPTGVDVHLWHTVPMIILNRLQRMWHLVKIIIWDFTASIWDPTWRVDERPALSDEDIKRNFSTYKEQMNPLFDFSKASIVYNSEWFNKMSVKDLSLILRKVNVSETLQRDDFRKRLEAWHGITQAELLYSVFMAIDSLELKNDIEVWGNDQLLNLQMCRKLMEINWLEPAPFLTTWIIEWTGWDGLKMSKSKNNYIGIKETPEEIFGKLMSIPDRLTLTYFKFLTEIYDEELEKLDQLMTNSEINPMTVKKLLARVIISVFYDVNISKEANKQFDNRFSKKEYNKIDDVVSFTVKKDKNIIDYLFENNFFESKSIGRRLIQQWWLQYIEISNNNRLKIINEKAIFWDIWLNEFFLKIGKKQWVIKINVD